MKTEPRVFSDTEELRGEFREWLRENLPEEWRNIGRTSDDLDRAVEVRRAWGVLLYQHGWAAPHWPVEYGGMGLEFEGVITYTEELVRSGAPESLNSNSMGILAPTILRYATNEQKQKYLPAMVRHDVVWCQGFSEPGAGSDLASLKTRAERVAGGYRVYGQKIWTSRAQYADLCYMLVRTTHDTVSKHEGISMAVVDMHQKEIEVRPIRNMAGSAEFNEVFVDGAFFPDDAIIGEEGRGWEVTRYALSRERGPRLVERAFRMEQEFGELAQLMRACALSSEQRTHFVQLAIDVRAVEATLRRMLDELAAGSKDTSLLSSVSKLSWSEVHQRVVEFAVEVLGADAVRLEGQYAEWMRALLLSRAETIYGGTSEVQRNLIARLIGMPSSAKLKGGHQ